MPTTLKLYVAGDNAKTSRALQHLREICQQFDEEFNVVVIDVLEQPQIAEAEKVLATPTIIKQLPLPIRRVIGDLSDVEKVLIGLDLELLPRKQQPSPESKS